MVQNHATFETDDTRTVSLQELRGMRERDIRLIDLLTAVSGYAEIALARDPEPVVCLQLEKIMRAAGRAADGVRSCLASVEEIERLRSD